MQTVFTIGHSNHPPEYFVNLLCGHGVTAICDVRSKPFSRLNPQFNREALKLVLQANGIAYVFLGAELGGRSDDPSCCERGQVQYERLANTDLFRQGIQRVQDGMKAHRVALMCAEKEPLECHRAILVARHLAAAGLDVQHIHADGRLESHPAALSRLAQQFKLREDNLFQSREEIHAEAYRLQEKRIAYSVDVPASMTAAG
jgi:uncharacterized protein (DUF488 family)